MIPLRTFVTSIAVAAAAGCASNPVAFSAPAPAGALECALRQAAQLGYQPTAGGVSSGYINFSAPIGNTGGAIAKETATRVMTLGMKGSNRPIRNEMTVTSGAGILRVQPFTLYENEKRGDVSATARADSEGILAACATPTSGSRVTG